MNKIKLIIFVTFIILTSSLMTAQEDEILTPENPCDKSGNAYDPIYCKLIKNTIEGKYGEFKRKTGTKRKISKAAS